MPIAVFLDSDVIISSLISSKGAAHFLIHNESEVDYYISTASKTELEKVVEELGLSQERLTELFDQKLGIIPLKEAEINNYGDFVTDIYDAHIIAGATACKAQFLITYNLKHYKMDKIKANLNIRVLTPALFLQYLRSI